jgi:hypothetical protein
MLHQIGMHGTGSLVDVMDSNRPQVAVTTQFAQLTGMYEALQGCSSSALLPQFMQQSPGHAATA